MKRNVGKTDSQIRLVAGIAALGVVAAGVITGAVAIVVGVAGVVLIASSVLHSCPGYSLMGISTCGGASCSTEGKKKD